MHWLRSPSPKQGMFHDQFTTGHQTVCNSSLRDPEVVQGDSPFPETSLPGLGPDLNARGFGPPNEYSDQVPLCLPYDIFFAKRFSKRWQYCYRNILDNMHRVLHVHCGPETFMVTGLAAWRRLQMLDAAKPQKNPVSSKSPVML